MIKWLAAAATAFALATSATAQQSGPAVELWRLDCGSLTIKNFNTFFSDTLEYKPGPDDVVASCYLIRHQDQYLLWDAGLPASLIGKPLDSDLMTERLTTTIADQLKQLKLTPADVDVVGISHGHFDHIGQIADFPQARLVIGKGDFAEAAGPKDPFGPWRKEGAKVTQATGDVDIFEDGSVVAIHLPGHTTNHMALRVNLASGPVFLSGDTYHATEARALRGVPPFNVNRAQSLASMDRFERLAKSQNARVIIQHEPADVAKLPAFPQSAK